MWASLSIAQVSNTPEDRDVKVYSEHSVYTRQNTLQCMHLSATHSSARSQRQNVRGKPTSFCVLVLVRLSSVGDHIWMHEKKLQDK